MIDETEINDFKALGLSSITLEAIKDKGFERPTDIQKLCIPPLLKENGNLIGQAQTGTGKTAAFALPILEHINEKSKNTQALVLVPTRELCMQVSEEIKSLAFNRKVSVAPIYGGASYSSQFKVLKDGCQIVVGTPGRIMDHLERETLNIENISFCVLDEADEMLDMGFIEDIESILSHTPQNKRMLCFSATMPKPILSLAEKFMPNYKLLRVEAQDITSDLTEQIFYEVREEDKFEVLCRTIDLAPDFYGLVFCKTKIQCDETGALLIARGYNAEVLHGDLGQNQRELIIHKMREHRINILVATDVAARGLDIPDLTHVVNYSLPGDPETYVHRVGRTGRAGKKGLGVTFVAPGEFRKFTFIKKISGATIQKPRVPSVENILYLKKQRLLSDIIGEIDKAEQGLFDDSLFSAAKSLTQNHHTTNVITALLAKLYGNALDSSSYKEIKDLFDRERQPRERDRKERAAKGKSRSRDRERSPKDFEKKKTSRPRYKTDFPKGKKPNTSRFKKEKH